MSQEQPSRYRSEFLTRMFIAVLVAVTAGGALAGATVGAALVESGDGIDMRTFKIFGAMVLGTGAGLWASLALGEYVSSSVPESKDQ